MSLGYARSKGRIKFTIWRWKLNDRRAAFLLKWAIRHRAACSRDSSQCRFPKKVEYPSARILKPLSAASSIANAIRSLHAPWTYRIGPNNALYTFATSTESAFFPAQKFTLAIVSAQPVKARTLRLCEACTASALPGWHALIPAFRTQLFWIKGTPET